MSTCAHSSRAHYVEAYDGACGPEPNKDNRKYLAGYFVAEHFAEGFEDGKLPSVLAEAEKMGYSPDDTLYDVLFANAENKKVKWPDKSVAKGHGNHIAEKLGDGDSAGTQRLVGRQAGRHEHVEFALAGAHEALACVRCHAHAHDLTPPAGGRFLGLSQQCTACHEDRHGGAFGVQSILSGAWPIRDRGDELGRSRVGGWGRVCAVSRA